jgi:hypothetical protein
MAKSRLFEAVAFFGCRMKPGVAGRHPPIHGCLEQHFLEVAPFEFVRQAAASAL